MYMPNAPAAAVGLEHRAKAGIISPVMADASGGAAIGQAWRQLVLGEADVAICGGVEARIEAGPVASFAQAGFLFAQKHHPRGARRPVCHGTGRPVVGGGGGALRLL